MTFGLDHQPHWSMKMDHAINAVKVVMTANSEFLHVYNDLKIVPWRKQPQGDDLPKLTTSRGVETKHKVCIAYECLDMSENKNSLFKTLQDEIIAFAEHFKKTRMISLN